MQADLQAIRDMVTGTALPSKVEEAILARCDQLPNLYAELNRTYETRFSDRIVATVADMIRILTGHEAGPGAPQLATTVVEHMRAMHNRYGISVVLKPPPVAKAKRK